MDGVTETRYMIELKTVQGAGGRWRADLVGEGPREGPHGALWPIEGPNLTDVLHEVARLLSPGPPKRPDEWPQAKRAIR